MNNILNITNGDSAILQLSGTKKLTQPIQPDQELSITEAGKEVLAGKRHWLDMIGLDRWIGGVHLTSENAWCWQTDLAEVKKRCYDVG